MADDGNERAYNAVGRQRLRQQEPPRPCPRNCAYQQEADTPCVYVNEIKQSLTANLNISRDTTLDPALKRTKAVRCPKCGNDEACFFARFGPETRKDGHFAYAISFSLIAAYRSSVRCGVSCEATISSPK